MSSVLGFVAAYFTSAPVLSVIGLNLAVITFLYLIFKVKREDSAARSRLLMGAFLLSIFNWVFVGGGLVLCQLLLEDYEYLGTLAIRRVLGLALLSGLTAVVPLSIIMTRRLPDLILRRLGHLEEASSRASRIMTSIRTEATDVVLRELPVSRPISFAVQGGGTNAVVVSSALLRVLDDEELESVIAHEMGHIKNGDARIKSLFASYRFLMRLDPLVPIIEAAFHRERELEADRFSAILTKKPLALASALIKIHEALSGKLPAHVSQISIVSSGGRLLAKSPPIGIRIERLLGFRDKRESVIYAASSNRLGTKPYNRGPVDQQNSSSSL